MHFYSLIYKFVVFALAWIGGLHLYCGFFQPQRKENIMEIIADFAVATLGTAALAAAVYALSPLLAVMTLPVLAPVAFMNLRA